jgi:hypothetical protein
VKAEYFHALRARRQNPHGVLTKRATEKPKHILAIQPTQFRLKNLKKLLSKRLQSSTSFSEQLDQYEAKVRLHDILAGLVTSLV